MAEVTDSIVVRAPLERTFRYLTDYTHALDWMDGMTEFALLGDQATGIGARVRATQRMLGWECRSSCGLSNTSRIEKLVSVSSGLVQQRVDLAVRGS